MIAKDAEARRWAKHVGFEREVVVDAALFVEHGDTHGGSVTARVYDSRGELIGVKRVKNRSRSATWTVVRRQGWDRRGKDGFLAGGTP